MSGWLSRLSLRRIIAHGRFIPEVDGFRFLAILIVVLAHTLGIFGTPGIDHALPLYFRREVVNGKIGVYLFFAISGFILALPFARSLLVDAKPVSLKRYFLRRITRLEPPYVLLMLLRFPMLVGYKHASVKPLAVHLGASLLYIHNFVYGYSSVIYPAAWSLEIEVQFYILAPLLAIVFAIRSHVTRQLVLISLILASALLSALFITTGTRVSLTILNYFQYFLAGFLLCDIYLTKSHFPLASILWDGIGILSLLLILLSNGLLGAAIVPFAIILLYLAGFHGHVLRAFFSWQAITIIGGMCYSIYLTHMLAISGIESLASRWHWMESGRGMAVVFDFAVCTGVALLIGTIYFIGIERPCMRPDWPAAFARRFKRLFATG